MIIAAILASTFVSIVIVIVHKQLDKNSRSFEKIAKLGKNIKEELNSLVEEKVQYLKDFDNCIDVSSQRAGYLLENLNKSISDLETMFKSLDNEKERVSSYYQKIENIDKDISLIADQVQEIKDSSDFFKNAMEKVSKFKKDVAGVERDIERLQDDFKKENSVSLRNVTNSIMKDASLQIDIIRKELIELRDNTEDKNNLFQAKIAQKESEFDKIIGEKERILSDFVEEQARIVKDKSDSFDNQASSIKETLSSLQNNFINLVIEEFKNLNDVNNANIERVKNDFTKIERDITHELDAKIADFKNTACEIEKYQTNINTEIKNSILTEKDKQLEDIRLVYTNILKEINGYNEKLKEDARKSIIKSVGESEEKLRNLIDNYKRIEKDTASKIATFESDFSDKEQKFFNLKNNIDSRLDNKEREFDSYIASSSEKIIKNVNQVIHKISSDAFGKTNEITNRFDLLYRDVENKIKEVEKDFSNKTQTIEKDLNEKTALISSSLKDTINSQTAKISDYQHKIENDIYQSINDKYTNYKVELENTLNRNYSNLNEFVETTKSEINHLKNDLLEKISDSKNEVEERKETVFSEFNTLSDDINNKLSLLGNKIEETIIKEEANINAIKDNLINNIENRGNILSAKIDEINNRAISIDNEIESKINGVEEIYNRSLIKLRQESADKYEEVSLNLNKLKNQIDNDVIVKIKEAGVRLKEEYKNLENESIETINSYKDDFNKIKNSIKSIDEKYNQKLNEKLDDVDKKLIFKMQDVNDIVDQIKEINNKYNAKFSEISTRGDLFETGLNEKINRIESQLLERGERILEGKLDKVNEISSRYNDIVDKINDIKSNIDLDLINKIDEGKLELQRIFDSGLNNLNDNYKNLEKETSENLETYKVEFNSLKDNIREIENNFEKILSEKFNGVANSLDIKNSEINDKFDFFMGNLKDRIANIEDEYKIKFANVEVDYRNNNEKFWNDYNERLLSLKGDYDNLNFVINDLKNNIDIELKNKIEKSKILFEEILVNEKNVLTDNYKSLEENTIKNIEKYNGDLERIKQNIKVIDEKFSNRFVKKLQDADLKFVEKLQEINGKSQTFFDNFESKVNTFEAMCNDKVNTIANEYKEKSDTLFNEKNLEVEEVKKQFEILRDQLNSFDLKINTFVFEKFEDGKKEIDSLLSHGRENIIKEYESLEEQTNRNIAGYKNELMKISQSIKQIDDKFMLKFEQKLNEVDSRVNDKISEIGFIYKDNIMDITNKIKVFETDFENKIAVIEKSYSEKGDLMVEKNYQKIDELRGIYQDLNISLNEIKLKIASDVTAKIEDSRALIESVVDDGIKNINVKCSDFDVKTQDKLNEYWNELLKVKDNVKGVENYFNEKVEEKSALFDTTINEKIGSIDSNLEKYALSVNEKIDNSNKEIDRAFEDKMVYIRKIYDEFEALSESKIFNYKEELNKINHVISGIDQQYSEFVKSKSSELENIVDEQKYKIESLNNDISLIKNNISTDIQECIEKGKKEVDSLFNSSKETLFTGYKSLENESLRRIAEYNEDLNKIKQNIKIIDDKFTGKFIRKLNDADEQLKDTIKEITDKYKTNFNEITHKTKTFETEIERKIGEIEKFYIEKGETLILDKQNKLADIQVGFNTLKDNIAMIKENIDSEILKKIEQNKIHIEELLAKGRVNLSDEFKKLAEEGAKEIAFIKNDILKTKENIRGIEGTFNEKFIEKISIYDTTFNKKIEEIGNVYKEYVNSLEDNLSKMEESFNGRFDNIESDIKSKNERILLENIDKLNDFTYKFNEIQSNINILKEKIENEIEEKIKSERNNIEHFLEERNAMLEQENKNIADNINLKFAGYYDELAKFKSLFEESRNNFNNNFETEALRAKESFNVLVERINEKYQSGIDELNKNIKEIESGFILRNQSILDKNIDSLEKVEERFNEISDEISVLKSKVDSDIEEKIKSGDSRINEMLNEGNRRLVGNFEQFNNEIVEKIAFYKDELNSVQKEIKSIDLKYEDDLSKKLSVADEKINSAITEINIRYKDSIDGLFNKVSGIEKDFYDKSLAIENNYVSRYEKIYKENYDRFINFNTNFTLIKESIDELKSKIDDEINTRIDNGIDQIDTILSNGTKLMKNDSERIIAEINSNIDIFKGEFSNLKVALSKISDNYDLVLSEKIKDYDSQLSAFCNDSGIQFKEKLNTITSSLDKMHSDFENKISYIQSDLNNKNEDILLKNKAYLEMITDEFNNISKEISDLKNNIDNEISFKITTGKESIEELFNEGSVKLKDDYRNLESETVKKINDYRNEIFKIKQNISTLDERFTSTFDEKVEQFDGMLNANINELNVKYKTNIDQIEKKLFDIEVEIQKNIVNIEKEYTSRAEDMIVRSADKLDAFVSRFDALNNEINALKNSIDSELTEKISTGKSEIKDILDKEILSAKETFKVTQSDFEQKIDEFKKEMLKVSQNVKVIDDKFTARFLEHSNILDKRIVTLEDTIKNIEKQAALFDKATVLKDKLNSDIKILKDEILIIKGEREDIVEIEKKMIDIKNIFTKTEEKSNLILADRKKIDNIGFIVNELKQVTGNIEEKIENVKNAKVMLANIEDKIELVNKKFIDLGEYLNLIKNKEDDVKLSLDGIEALKVKSDELNGRFDALNKKYDDLDFKKSIFEKSLKNFEKDAGVINKSEAKLSEVLEKFEQMDSFVEDLEMRTESINRIREWLVRAETQIENMNNETDKRIRLFESLMSKTGESPLITEKMKNESSKKETVLHLQSLGWTIDDIAKTLGLSLGEVDFILDLELSKKK